MRNESQMKRSLLAALTAACLSLFLVTGCAAPASQPPANEPASLAATESESLATATDLAAVPDYAGEDTIELNGGIPAFTADDLAVEEGTEAYGKLDDQGRATGAFAKLCENTRPKPGSKRNTDMPDPTGWVQAFYPEAGIDHLYERSHLIAYSLSDEAVNPCDLFTGTEHLNQDTMGRIEGKIRGYLNSGSGDSRHVLMRVTPDFRGTDLVARGVQIEVLSLEDDGRALCMNVYCYNIQPGVIIDYATGESRRADSNDTAAPNAPAASTQDSAQAPSAPASQGTEQAYVLNTNTKKFHLPDCRSVSEMKAKNKKEMSATREALIEEGYQPCGRCKP